MWDFINSVTGDIQQLVDYLARHPDKIPVLLKAPPAKSEVAESADTRAVMHHALFYVLDGLLPFLHVSRKSAIFLLGLYLAILYL